MANVLDNAIWVFVVVICLIALGIGYNIMDNIYNETVNLTNASLQNMSGTGRNLLNTSDPMYNLTKTVYVDNLPRYAELRTFWLDAITFLITVLIAFMFVSSFSTNHDIIEYAYLFVLALIVSSIINYVIIEIYNSMMTEFAILGFSTDAFLTYFIGNYQAILVLNILGFLGNVIFQKIRYGVQM